MGDPRVSVLLPIYNGGAFLRGAIDSIVGQSFGDFELILYDDASQDRSAEIAEAAAARDPRLRSVRGERNLGLGGAMTRLAALARGEYLAIQEQDDVSAGERLARQVALLDARPEVGLVSGIAEWVDLAGRRQRLFPGLLARGGQYPQDSAAMVRYLYVEQCKVVNAAAMFRREVLHASADRLPVFFDAEARMSVDWQFFLRLAHGWAIWGLPEILVTMRRDEGHASLTRRKDLQFAEARRCLRRLYDELEGDPRSPIDAALYRRALATQELLEARHGGARAWRRWLAALRHDPVRAETWRGLAELPVRGLRRLRGAS